MKWQKRALFPEEKDWLGFKVSEAGVRRLVKQPNAMKKLPKPKKKNFLIFAHFSVRGEKTLNLSETFQLWVPHSNLSVDQKIDVSLR